MVGHSFMKLKITYDQFAAGIVSWWRICRHDPSYRLGQHLANVYGKPEQSYPDLFYCANADVPNHLEFVNDG